MKENEYDNPEFFREYCKMSRSVKGLAGAGEWHALKRLMPDFTGKRVLDLGCGFGWHCRWARQQGAASVLGIDLSRNMLDRARALTQDPGVEYRACAMEDYEYPPLEFDVVLSSLAFHYTEDFPALCRRIYSTLRPGGDFVFSVEHPVFTACGSQDWYRDGQGEILHWPVDHYFSEGRRDAVFLGKHVVKYHRTLTTYLSSLFEAGFALSAVTEPEPDPAMLEEPGMRDELRRPMMLLAAAKKPA